MSLPRISHSAKPNPKGALSWVYVMWSDEELGKAVFGKVVDQRKRGVDPRAEGKIGLASLKSHLKAKIPADWRAAAIRKWWQWSRMVALVNTAGHWYFSS